MTGLILDSKSESIICLFDEIISIFGNDFFDTYRVGERDCIIDFWEADLSAIGLKKDNKVVYISNWNFRFNKENEMSYYVAFEIINIETMETINTVKDINEINRANLILELKLFFASNF